MADTKCADAGGTVAKNNAVRGADWMTCICCATIPTMEAALKAIKTSASSLPTWSKQTVPASIISTSWPTETAALIAPYNSYLHNCSLLNTY